MCHPPITDINEIAHGVQLGNQKSKLIARVATSHEDRRPLEGPVVDAVVHRAFGGQRSIQLSLESSA
jgi:hypothetical protein